MTIVTITTANTLDSKTLLKIKNSLNKKIEGKVEFRVNVIPSVVGGLRISIGSKEIDMTVKSQLDQISSQLIKQLN